MGALCCLEKDRPLRQRGGKDLMLARCGLLLRSETGVNRLGGGGDWRGREVGWRRRGGVAIVAAVVAVVVVAAAAADVVIGVGVGV